MENLCVSSGSDLSPVNNVNDEKLDSQECTDNTSNIKDGDTDFEAFLQASKEVCENLLQQYDNKLPSVDSPMPENQNVVNDPADEMLVDTDDSPLVTQNSPLVGNVNNVSDKGMIVVDDNLCGTSHTFHQNPEVFSVINGASNNGIIVVENGLSVTTVASHQSPDVVTDFADTVTVDVEDSLVSPQKCCLDFKRIPFQITGSWKEFVNASQNNFTKGCKWSPDGSCILTCSDDAKMRLFNLPTELCQTSINWGSISEMFPALLVPEAELIYDYCWYPHMSSLDPVSCCFASSSRCNPVHMWDAFTGELRCTYRSYNHVDEIVAAHGLAFDSDGQKLYCGFKNMIRVFDVSIPGRNFRTIPTCVKKCGQKGIVSCFAFSSENRSVFAVGSYNKTVGLYSESDGSLMNLLDEHKGGVTHMCFSPSGYQLYSGGRKDPEIRCWDLRNLRKSLFQLRRICNTNQRLYFDVSRCGQYVASGNQNGVVTIWNVKDTSKHIYVGENVILEPIQFYQAHHDCVNGISFHPNLPLLTTSSGQRKFPEPLDSEGEESSDGAMFTDKHIVKDNSIRLWWIGSSMCC